MNTIELTAEPFPWRFILSTYVTSWTAWFTGWLATGRPDSIDSATVMIVALVLGSFGPNISAALLLYREGEGRLGQWLRGFIRLKIGWRPFMAAILPFPLLILLFTLALGYAPIAGSGDTQPPYQAYATIFPLAILNGIITVFLGAGPLGEEGGWRGYLLPRLLSRWPVWQASLFIGIVWATWHLPIMAMFPAWRNDIPFWTYLPLYTFVVTGFSFMMARVWIISSGSLLPLIWLHGIINAVGWMAFNPAIWSSRWPVELGGIFLGLCAFLTAAIIWKLTTLPADKEGPA